MNTKQLQDRLNQLAFALYMGVASSQEELEYCALCHVEQVFKINGIYKG